MPAMPDPSAKVNASTQDVRIPIEEAMRRFCVTARICRPKAERFKRSRSATNTPSEKTMIQSRFQVMER